MIFKKVLFPVDFSAPCLLMAPTIVAVALRSHAAVDLLHVLELPPGVRREAPGYLNLGDITSFRCQAEQELRRSFSGVFDGINASFCVDEGDPSGIIIQYAGENQIDLVCMPTRGWGPFRRLLLGSVTAKVLNDLDLPVLTGAHYENETFQSSTVFKSILCCIDLSEDSTRVVQWGARVAHQFEADLRVMHALPAVEEPTENRGVLEVNRYHKEKATQRYADIRDQVGFDGVLHLVGGSVAHAARQTAIEQNADLIVIGRGVMREHLGRMRTNTYAIIRESPCPVLSV